MAEPVYPSLKDEEKTEQGPSPIGFEGLEEEQQQEPRKISDVDKDEIELLPPGEYKRPKVSSVLCCGGGRGRETV